MHSRVIWFGLAGLLCLALSSALFAYPPQFRADTPVSRVAQACQEASDSQLSNGYCAGFIEAAYNTVEHWCVPPEVKRSELMSTVMTGLQNFVERGLEAAPAAPTITTIIVSTWPCG